MVVLHVIQRVAAERCRIPSVRLAHVKLLVQHVQVFKRIMGGGVPFPHFSI